MQCLYFTRLIVYNKSSLFSKMHTSPVNHSSLLAKQLICLWLIFHVRGYATRLVLFPNPRSLRVELQFCIFLLGKTLTYRLRSHSGGMPNGRKHVRHVAASLRSVEGASPRKSSNSAETLCQRNGKRRQKSLIYI